MKLHEGMGSVLGDAILDGMVRKGLSLEVTLKQMTEGREAIRRKNIWEEHCRLRG